VTDDPREQTPADSGRISGFIGLLQDCYATALQLNNDQNLSPIHKALGAAYFQKVAELAQIKHAARGVVLTLAAYKAYQPSQDVRAHKAEHPGGFSGRVLDTDATVPFLAKHSLAYNVQTHWLSQTFSIAGPYTRESKLATIPKRAGILTVEVINDIQEKAEAAFARWTVVLILYLLIDERNKGQVHLTKPKNLTIDEAVRLLRSHFLRSYKKNAPRLPQIAVYALYKCLVDSVVRYKDCRLEPLMRMKAADRKAGTVGDVVVTRDKHPVEAVETKFDVPITAQHVAEAIEKVRAASVERYFLLSTGGIESSESQDIDRLRQDFRQSNGCEIVVDGVLETVAYYLRLLRSTGEFVIAYTEILEKDLDLDYEHRIAWNELCVTAGK